MARVNEVIGPYLSTAGENANMGGHIPEDTRLRAVKQAMVRVSRVVTHEQLHYNQAVIAALEAVSLAVGELQAESELAAGGSRERINAIVASLEATVGDLAAAVGRVDARVAALEERNAVLERHLAAVQADVASIRTGFEGLRATPGPDAAAAAAPYFRRRLDPMYAEFEARFRGSHDDIRSRLEKYLDDFLPLKEGEYPVADVGCGRGEWLELLRDNGIPAFGIDSNEDFARTGGELGLEVRLGDALAELRSVPEGSLGAVTAFHLAEHLEFEYLVEFLDTCLRAIRPGGLVLFETPNPTNLDVGAASFYLDPTHLRPLHPQFFEFLLRERAFVDTEVRLVNPPSAPPLAVPPTASAEAAPTMRRLVDELNTRFFVPCDYAVLGRRAEA